MHRFVEQGDRPGLVAEKHHVGLARVGQGFDPLEAIEPRAAGPRAVDEIQIALGGERLLEAFLRMDLLQRHDVELEVGLAGQLGKLGGDLRRLPVHVLLALEPSPFPPGGALLSFVEVIDQHRLHPERLGQLEEPRQVGTRLGRLRPRPAATPPRKDPAADSAIVLRKSRRAAPALPSWESGWDDWLHMRAPLSCRSDCCEETAGNEPSRNQAEPSLDIVSVDDGPYKSAMPPECPRCPRNW